MRCLPENQCVTAVSLVDVLEHLVCPPAGVTVYSGHDYPVCSKVNLEKEIALAGVRCSVVGVPKTIDGDLKNDAVAISFGFDTACKVCLNLYYCQNMHLIILYLKRIFCY